MMGRLEWAGRVMVELLRGCFGDREERPGANFIHLAARCYFLFCGFHIALALCDQNENFHFTILLT